jgi:hypothetical protein
MAALSHLLTRRRYRNANRKIWPIYRDGIDVGRIANRQRSADLETSIARAASANGGHTLNRVGRANKISVDHRGNRSAGAATT